MAKQVKIPEISTGQQKLIITLLVVAAVLLLGWWLYNEFLSEGAKERKEEKKQKKALEDEIKKDAPSGGTTIGTGKAAEIADALQNAMDNDGWAFGTQEQVMFNLLKGLTGADLNKVFIAFGKRKYFWTGSSEIFGSDKNLFEWFASELGTSDLTKMKQIWAKSSVYNLFP